MHRHRVHTTETIPFAGCISHPCNLDAHGGSCVIERCKCGAWRATNRNGDATERALWELPAPRRGPGRPRVDSAQMMIRMPGPDLIAITEAARIVGARSPSTWVRELAVGAARGVLDATPLTPACGNCAHRGPVPSRLNP